MCLQNNNCLDTQILIETLISKVDSLQKTNDLLHKSNELLIARVTVLEEELSIYKNKKNSGNSHIPPSRDENRPMKNQSLREKSGKKPGGQQGHEGKTLKCSSVIDETIKYAPDYCNCCGKNLIDAPEALIETRQVIDIPVIKPLCTEHRIYRKICSCGHSTESNFPSYISAKVQYGANVESLIGYLHARQYLPYQRMKEFFTDVMGLPVSVGGINNILNRFIKKATPHHQQIKERIMQAVFVGTDETGTKVNGQKDWMWT